MASGCYFVLNLPHEWMLAGRLGYAPRPGICLLSGGRVSSASDRIIAWAHSRVLARYWAAGAEVPPFEELVGEVAAEIGGEMDRRIRKAGRHLRAAAELSAVLRQSRAGRAVSAGPALTDSDLAMLAAGAPVPREVTDNLGVGPEPWHPEHHRIESD